jgi:pSer/pThr/pTyr-binding forkhead associated (FHA) protein
MSLTLEIIEGPGAGRQFEVDRSAVIGRSPNADFQLDDAQTSRNHARVTPDGSSALIVEDLKSANGTFVNDNEVYDTAVLEPGDDLLLGVTLMRAHSSPELRVQGSAVRAIPSALATPESPAHYIDQEALAADLPDASTEVLSPELERYRDVRVRTRAHLAPLAFALLVALAVCLYLVTR